MENENAKSTQTRGIIIGLIAGIAIASIIFSVIMVFQNATKPKSILTDADIRKIQEITGIIDKSFYEYSEDVTTDNIREGIFYGIMESLNDPYSEYYSVEELQESLNTNAGISYGIGCYVSIDNEKNMPVIAGTIEGSPAEAAGLKEGDIIYKVDDVSTLDLKLSEVVSMIKGLEGTFVHVSILRGEELLEFDIERKEVIETSTVTYGTLIDNNKIGYIKISEFNEATVQQYIDAMDELNKENIEGLILDLRSNPGGTLTAAVDIARQILPAGIIVYTEDKAGERKDYTCDGENELKIPLVVLTNGYTASASEILAGAIKDYNKGTLIGTKTFGKGIVQRIISLSDGSAVKITISAYFTPSGINIQAKGIEPDIVLEYDYDTAYETGDDNQVNKAIEILEQKMGK